MREFSANHIPKPPLTPVSRAWSEFASVDLEIGGGSGMFAANYCLANPERSLVCVERTLLRSQLLLERASGVSNLFAYRADAVAFVTHFVPVESLSRIFILYPNPYVKGRQANLRWHNMPFMNCLLQRLRVGGQLVLATNLEWYFSEARDRFVGTWGLHEVSAGLVGAGVVGIAGAAPRTLFEKKYLERGEKCWNLVVEKLG